MKLMVKCNDYEGELVSISPDTLAKYDDGSADIKAYKVTLENVCGDIIVARHVWPDNIETYKEEE